MSVQFSSQLLISSPVSQDKGPLTPVLEYIMSKPDFLPGFLPGYVDTIVFHQSFSEFSLEGGLKNILLNVQSLKDPV